MLSGFFGLVAAAAPNGNATGQNSTDYVLVRFSDAAVAEYAGGIAGYLATKPNAGHKLNLASAAVVKYEAYLGSQHANYRAWLKANAPQAEILSEFLITFNGFAVLLHGASANSLMNGPKAAEVTPDWTYSPSMDVSVPLINAPEVWSDLGVDLSATPPNYGDLSQIKVGVIDSGIIPGHPFIDSCRESNPVVHRGLFFSGMPFGTAYVNPHGTHVAGTIGGCVMTGPVNVDGEMMDLAAAMPGKVTGYLSGVAPGVSLYDYNVFPGMGVGYYIKGGTAFSQDIMAAVEDSVKDGMDVISLSLGGGVQGPHDLLAQAINNAVDAGVVAVVAAGNAGPGAMTVESPGNAENAITVAASSNAHFAAIAVSPDGKGPYAGVVGDFGTLTDSITKPYVRTTPANGCSAITNDVSGDIAVIVRGTCSFSVKIRFAQQAGAVGVVMINNQPGDPIIMGQDGTPNQPTIPAVMVSQPDGTNFGASGTVTVDGTAINEFASPYGDVIQSFSGRGPTPYNFLLKPDVTAPGANVLSSVFSLDTTSGSPVYTPYFAFFQGTSMATPHVTGSVALLLAEHPGWTPAEVKSAIVNTADRPVWSDATKTASVSALARGGGRVDVPAASASPVAFAPASLSFGITMGNAPIVGSIPVTLTSLEGAASCTFTVTGPGATVMTVPSGAVGMSAGGTASMTVGLNAGQGATAGFYTGDVVAACTVGEVTTTLRLPYLFVVGGSNGFLQGNMNSRNPPGFGTAPGEFTAPDGYAAGAWTK